MKRFFTLFILVLTASNSFSQTPNWLWGEVNTGGTCNTDTKGLWAGPSGNIYVGGRMGGTLAINGASATSPSGTAVFSAKMDSNGNFSWITPHPYSGGNDYDYGFGADIHENTYVTGLTQGSNGFFLDKYNSAGTKVWSFAPGSLASGIGGYGNVAVDKAGNVFATGSFGGTQNFGPNSLTAVGPNDMFLVKLDSNGICKWAIKAGAPGQQVEGRGTAVDAAGNIYVCGSYNGTASFGSITLPSVNADGFFIAKYDTGGIIQWVQNAPNAGFNSGAPYWSYEAITIDSCANTYVTGHFINTAQFGPITLTNSNSNYDIFVAKCNANGTWEWAKSAGGTNNDEAWGLVLDKYSDVYISGYFVGSAKFDNQTVSSTAAATAFVAKYANSTGDLQWVQAPTGSCTTYGVGLAIDKKGHCYLTGSIGTSGSATFGPNALTGQTGCAVFFAKLDTVPQRSIIPTVQPSYCPGSIVTLPYNIIGTFNAGNVFTAQLSNDSGSFISPVTLGDTSLTSDGNITITIPANTPAGSDYLIRVISSNPATSSYANGCGTYFKNNVYVNNFYVTIGGGTTLNVTPDTSACAGSSVQLNVTGGGNYTWSPNTNLSCTNCATPVASPVSTQTYTVTSNASTACSASASVVVTVTPGITLNVSPHDTSVCSGTQAQLNVSGATSYTWSSTAGLTCTNCPNPMVTPTDSVTILYVSGSSGNCSVKDSVKVLLGNSSVAGTITTPRDTICQGTAANLTLVNSVGTPIQWQTAADTTANFSPVGNGTTTYRTDPLLQTTYFRVTVGSGSCTSTTKILQLYIPPALTAAFSSTESGRIATFNSGTSQGNITSYYWDFGDGAISNDSNPVHSFAKDSIYDVCLTIYDGSNCSYTFCRTVSITVGVATISASGSFEIYPNPFGEWISVNEKGPGKSINNIELYDMLGRMVQQWNSGMLTNNPNTLNVSTLANGMYYLKIKTAKTDFVQKVIKQ